MTKKEAIVIFGLAALYGFLIWKTGRVPGTFTLADNPRNIPEAGPGAVWLGSARPGEAGPGLASN